MKDEVVRCRHRWSQHLVCGTPLTFATRDGVLVVWCDACARHRAGWCAECPSRLATPRARCCPRCQRRHAAAAVTRYIARDPARWRTLSRDAGAAWRQRHGQAAKDYKRAWDQAHRRNVVAA